MTDDSLYASSQGWIFANFCGFHLYDEGYASLNLSQQNLQSLFDRNSKR
jgi:hypothetical protein